MSAIVEAVEVLDADASHSAHAVAGVLCRTFSAFSAFANFLEDAGLDINSIPRGENFGGLETEYTLLFRCDELLVALAGDEPRIANFHSYDSGTRSYVGGPWEVEMHLGCATTGFDYCSALDESAELPQRVAKAFGLPDIAATIAAGVGPQVDPGDAIEGPVANRFFQTESGMSGRVAATYGDRLHYVTAWKKWIVWDGRRWVVDDGPRVDAFIRASVKSLFVEARRILEQNGQQAFEAATRFALKMSSARSKNAVRDLLTSEKAIAIEVEQLDANDFLFNVANGVVDVRRSKLLPHDPRLLLTKLSPVEFVAGATCPKWLRFLDEIFDGDRELIRYVQRAVGYSLSGDVREHKLFLLHGTGANGKTTFIETLCAMLGDYAGTAPPDLLMVKGDTHPVELADLYGYRLVACSETEDGRRFAEARVKQLTGGDTLKARRMRENFWSFRPAFKLWLATNYTPDLRGTDGGIRRRINLLPFKVSFASDAQDKRLAKKLRDELPGILQWALEGARCWLADGLGEPQAVQLATNEYLTSQDTVAGFIAAKCSIGDGYEVKAKLLYEAYQVWCESESREAVSATKFGTSIARLGYASRKSGTTIYIGLRLGGLGGTPG